MMYQTKLDNTYYQVDIPVYDELKRKIGTAEVKGDKAELTINQNSELVEKMMKENLLRVVFVSCSIINYKKFINELN